ncbi:hypothetical protein LCGC14_0220880 [marine sediment metagenome]|uniref:Uncharacterized protein n=1 Tax=marine sediment metagenome TaxID=412755 RepID=A0A0F9UDF3_9ZZZZ
MKTLTTEEQRKIKDRFEKHVDRRSRKDMIDFLTSHFRYHTMSSWNRSTSYAHCIKLHHLSIPDDICDTMYDMVFNDEWGNHFSEIIDLFSMSHDDNWVVGTNGRSGGYLVLYKGTVKNGRRGCLLGSIDQEEDFHEWDRDELRARVNSVCSFDMLVSNVAMEFVAFCRTYNIIDETIMVQKTVQVLREKQ